MSLLRPPRMSPGLLNRSQQARETQSRFLSAPPDPHVKQARLEVWLVVPQKEGTFFFSPMFQSVIINTNFFIAAVVKSLHPV